MKNLKIFFIIISLLFISSGSAFAAKIPDNVSSVIKKALPNTDFRFDGVIILSDGTLYLPLFPAMVKTPNKIYPKFVYPTGTSLAQKPNVVIFNNDFALLKVLVNDKGQKTVQNMQNPPLEIRTGLLPQDMLVPQGLIIPDNLKGIIGNLQISTTQDNGLRVAPDALLTNKVSQPSRITNNISGRIPELQNKVIYAITCYSKNIQVINGENRYPAYGLALKGIPIDFKAYNNDKFLLVTVFSKNSLYVISLADERIIKQVDLPTQPEEIVIDRFNNKAYVSSSSASCIYLIDLKTMTLKQKIKIKGMCEKFTLSQDGKKLFYSDKLTNEVWCVELSNGYIIKDIGKFPNVSKIAFTKGNVYLISRTKNRLAVIDYSTLKLLKETEIAPKPVDMLVYKNDLLILSADKNIVQFVNTDTNTITNNIGLSTKGFSTKICPITNSNLALITDTKAGKYSVLNLDTKTVIRTNLLAVPVSSAIVANRVKKIRK